MGEAQASLSRRSFLKTAGATAALAAAGGMTGCDGWLAETRPEANKEEHVAYIRHLFHCCAQCCLKVTVRDGRIVLIEPNDALDPDDRHICLRGIAEIQHVYSKDRIQTPLKRVGERGEGKFVPCSWDEAIKLIADAIKDVQAKYGDNAFYTRKSAEVIQTHGFSFLKDLLHAEAGGLWNLDQGVDFGQANGMVQGINMFAFLPHMSLDQVKTTSTYVNWGTNGSESNLVWQNGIQDAKESGATKIITIDPRFSPTASFGHQWIGLKPGTDLAFALAVIKVILQNEWYDKEYVQLHTSLPFLLNKVTGRFLHSYISEVDAASPEETGKMEQAEAVDTSSQYFVYDNASGAVVSYLEAEDPALMCEVEYQGETYIPAFVQLCDSYEQYTPEWAADITGLDVDTIIGFADDYANRGPAIISYGQGGPDKLPNSDILGHALAVLTSITGNFGRAGADSACYNTGSGAAYSGVVKDWTLPEEFYENNSFVRLYDYPRKPNNIHAMLLFGDVAALCTADANATYEWIKTLDFFANSDIYFTSSTLYADVVLPACSKFECAEEFSDLRINNNYVSLTQKVLDPLFEAKEDLEVERLLAAEWGYDKYLPSSYRELAEHKLSEVSPNMEGISVEYLQSHQGIMRLKDSYAPIIPSIESVFGTATGRAELYYESFLDMGLAFPAWEPCSEIYAENPLREKYPLVFSQGKTRYRIHSTFSGSTWMEEFYGPTVDMNPVDAKARGLNNGDKVRVSNDRGSFICNVAVTNTVMPGHTFMAETTYKQHFEEGFMQNVTNPNCNERGYMELFGPMIPFNDTLVEIQKA